MIEFRCQSCQGLLRTPPGTEGRQAKCPQCGALMTVPGQSRPADFSAPPPRDPDFGAAAASGPAASGTAADSSNPYHSPAYTAAAESPAGPRGFRPTRIALGETLDRTWRLFRDNFGLLVGAMLVVIGVTIAVSIVFGIAQIAANGGDFDNRQPQTSAAIAVNALSNLVGAVMNTFFYLGMIRLTLKAARGEDAGIGDLFGEGNRLLPGLVANFVFGIAALLGFVLLIVTGIWVVLSFNLILYMIVDQEAGIGESFRLSYRAMRGNRLVLLGLGLLLFVASIPLVLLTCGLGALFVGPFVSMMMTVVYLGTTGQFLGDEPTDYVMPDTFGQR